ncbi:GNAT family N-acetyltransferase [Streptomyces eurythermus]
MVTLCALALDDAPALTRIYSGASIRYTTGKPLTLDQAHDQIRTALARAAETPRAQWSWGILHESDLIGLISLRRRTPTMGTISYILRDDSWGNGYATHQVVTVAFTTAGLNRLEAMHHPDNPASGGRGERIAEHPVGRRVAAPPPLRRRDGSRALVEAPRRMPDLQDSRSAGLPHRGRPPDQRTPCPP